jgi:phenylalanyl-tRNA synthetase beta chain
MKVLLSWLKDFVDIDLPLPDLVHRLTMAGLEVEDVRLVGLPMPQMAAAPHAGSQTPEVSVSGLEWAADKIVVASVSEVAPHPNADRLVLCKLFDGQQEHIVLTGAPNLFPYKGIGPLEKPLKVAYAKEGAKIYDGHQPGQVLTTLKRAKIRGVDSYSMICSEKELGISDEHEGVIILDDDAPVGAPLVDYMGDAVFEIAILPNIARAASIYGVAREVAALTGQPLRGGAGTRPIASSVAPPFARIDITNPEMNPRFVLGLIRHVTIAPSPYWLQRRLKLAGMRPISNIVDATNYAMLELGEPLHAFDYDVLVERASRQAGREGGPAEIPTIITRTARPGERLTTLDGVDRPLDDFTELVCDTAGALSLAGVMGGAESEVTENTRNILLEGAAWNNINIRRTVAAQKLNSEAAYRFSRGVHPALAERGVRRCLDLMQQLTGGVIEPALVDNYPLPPVDPVVEIAPADVTRWLGIALTVDEILKILTALEFRCEIMPDGSSILAHTPDHRLDIGAGIIGKADLMEEIARIYGYDRIPETRLADDLPVQRNNLALDREERLRDLLTGLGFQEIINYRLTTPSREARRLPAYAAPDDRPYVRLANPIASDRDVLRHSLLASVLETVERNARLRPRLALFEIGPIFMGSEASELPDELQRLVIAIIGPRALPGWQLADAAPMDFYDLKGLLTVLLDGLRLAGVRWEPASHPSFHPGKCARILAGEKQVGVMGELHPLVRQRYDLPASGAPLMAADLDLDTLLPLVPERYAVADVPSFPPVLEDLALVVDETLPADRVAAAIQDAGGKIVAGVRLFDVYRGEKLGHGKKSLAYSIIYQAPNKTLSDKDVAGIRTRIIRRLEQDLGAKLRA